MAYVPVPKDLSKVKTKVLFGLTKRQLICFSGGALIGIPLFFLTRGALGTSLASLLMVFSMLPMFLLAMYEKNGQPMEKLARNYLNSRFFRPKVRPYRTNNYYAVLERQYQFSQEVNRIASQGKTRRKSHRKAAQGHRRRRENGTAG